MDLNITKIKDGWETKGQHISKTKINIFYIIKKLSCVLNKQSHMYVSDLLKTWLKDQQKMCVSNEVRQLAES